MTLIGGGYVSDEEVRFNPNNYHFYRGQEDITNRIPRSEKLRFVPDFDVERENRRISAEMGAGGSQQPLSESTIGALANQVMNDGILAAPLESLDRQVGLIFKSTGVRLFLALGAVAAGVWVYREFYRR